MCQSGSRLQCKSCAFEGKFPGRYSETKDNKDNINIETILIKYSVKGEVYD